MHFLNSCCSAIYVTWKFANFTSTLIVPVLSGHCNKYYLDMNYFLLQKWELFSDISLIMGLIDELKTCTLRQNLSFRAKNIVLFESTQTFIDFSVLVFNVVSMLEHIFMHEVSSLALDVRVDDDHQLTTLGSQVGHHFTRVGELFRVPCEVSWGRNKSIFRLLPPKLLKSSILDRRSKRITLNYQKWVELEHVKGLCRAKRALNWREHKVEDEARLQGSKLVVSVNY